MKASDPIASDPRITMTFTHVQQHKKSLLEAYVLCLTLGFLGAHHFYLNRPWYGVAYFFTLGLFGFGYLIDLFRLPFLVRDTNSALRDPTLQDRKYLDDAYVLWFPFGILGFHLFYLRKPGQGLLYFFTFGIFGIGFLVDLFRMPSLVRQANEYPPGHRVPKTVCEAYLFGLSPLGLLGAHHFYLDRPVWGILYFFTFGLFGFGWVYDWFRMPCLVTRVNETAMGERDAGLKTTDDIFVLWFPLGFLGFHHFYLDRPGWGFLYFFTFGLFGIGWLIDGCRLSCLVRDYNKSYVERQLLAHRAQNQFGGTICNTATGQTVVSFVNPTTGIMSPPNQILMPPPYVYQSIGVTPNTLPPGYQGYPTGYTAAQQGAVENAVTQPGVMQGPVSPPSYEESVSGAAPAGTEGVTGTAGAGTTETKQTVQLSNERKHPPVV